MESLKYDCPMCCGETFNNLQSLKYHLLSMMDNLYCPGCLQHPDSIMALIQHLDHCGQDLEIVEEKLQQPKKEEMLGEESQQEAEPHTEILMDANVDQLNQTFLATVNNEGIMIMDGSETIQVDENGDIKVIEKMDVDGPSTMDFKLDETLNCISTEDQTKSTNSLVTSSISAIDDKSQDKSIITILPSGSELLDGETNALINMDHINDVEALDEAELLHVKQEGNEQ